MRAMDKAVYTKTSVKLFFVNLFFAMTILLSILGFLIAQYVMSLSNIGAAFIAGYGFMIGVVAFSLYITPAFLLAGSKTFIYDFNHNRLIAYFPKTYFTWPWDNQFNQFTSVTYCRWQACSSFIESSVNLTNGRSLTYCLTVDTCDNVDNFITALHKAVKDGFNELEDWLVYMAYEFEHAHRDDLLRLYNPKDESQQRQFFTLVDQFLKHQMEFPGQLKMATLVSIS